MQSKYFLNLHPLQMDISLTFVALNRQFVFMYSCPPPSVVLLGLQLRDD